MYVNNQTPFSVFTSKSTYYKDSEISVKFSGLDINNSNVIAYNIVRVFEDYSIYESTLSGSINIDNDEISIVSPLTVQSEGIYLIASVTLSFVNDKGEIESFNNYNIDKDFKTYPFKITHNECEKDFNNEKVYEEYVNILNIRNAINLSGFGNRTSTSKVFDIYFFTTGVLMTVEAFYDQCNLIPFEAVEYSDTINYLNKFLTSKALPNLPYPLKPNELSTHQAPGLIINFPIVFAETVEEAGEITEKHVEYILKALALSRGANGTILGSVLIDKSTMLPYHRIYKPIYRGNLLTGFDFGENPRKNKVILSKIKNDDTLNLCLTIYSETLKEDNIEVAYFKLWSILEVLYERNKPILTIKPGKHYLDGMKISKGNNIKPTTKDNVRELIRHYFNKNNYLSNLVMKNSLFKTPDDLLTIWYRHRNCLVHSGGCRPNDISHCKINKPDFNLCNAAHNSVMSMYNIRNKTTDNYFGVVNSVIRTILLYETQ